MISALPISPTRRRIEAAAVHAQMKRAHDKAYIEQRLLEQRLAALAPIERRST